MGSVHDPRITYWTEQCQRHFEKSAHLKRAGGDEVPFEQAFANLAHSYLRNKAPELLDYELDPGSSSLLLKVGLLSAAGESYTFVIPTA